MEGDRGQTTIEWLGIAAVVVAILVAVPATGMGQQAVSALSTLICQVTGGEGCGARDGEELAATRASGAGGSGLDGRGDGGASSPAAHDGQAARDADATAAVAGPGQRGDDELSPDELAEIAEALESGDPAAIHDALSDLSDPEITAAVAALRDQLATTDGVPQPIRVAANAERIREHIAQLEAELATLDPDDDGGRIGAIEDWIEDHNPLGGFIGPPGADTDAERAEQIRRRIAMLEQWVEEERQIILFEPPADIVNGDGLVVEVFGDLETADHVGVVIPGISNTPDNYDEGLRQSVLEIAGATGPDTALVAHLGYDTPDSLLDGATMTGARARDAAPDAASLIDSLDADGRDRNVTLVGHSYGTRVAAETAQIATDIDSLILIGSPGTGVDTAVELGVDPQHVYIGRNTNDEIRFVPPVSIGDVGHGRDPTDEGYGGQLLTPGDGTHGDYWDPDDPIGGSVAAIVDGRPDDAQVAADRGEGVP